MLTRRYLLVNGKCFVDTKKVNFLSILKVGLVRGIWRGQCSCAEIILAESSLFCIHNYWNMHPIALLIKRQDSMKDFI